MNWKMLKLDTATHCPPEYGNPFVLVCDDVGTIVSATVNTWTDNYPYFRLNLLTDRGYFECSHKYSYMGAMHGICAGINYADLVWKFLPERIPYFADGARQGDFSRETALARCKANPDAHGSGEHPRVDSVYFTDPRLQYLAYAGIIGRESCLYGTMREHYFAPHMKGRKEALAWLKKFDLDGAFCTNRPDEEFYDKFKAAYQSLRKAHRGRQLT